MNKKSSKKSTSNENYSHLELFNLGKIFFKEKKFIDFRSKGNRGGFEAIKDINLKIEKNSFVSIIGPSGCGKSTLLKIIMKRISPEIGEINLGKHNIITSYYEQNQAEALSLKERVIDLIFKKSPEWPQKKVRTFLGGFGFQNETVFKFIKQLSGGEKARLALALMIMIPSNFLLFDEPTNHLDLQSKDNLELAIKNYKGSLLIVSHDRYFISKVANRIVEIKDSKFFSYDGSYEYFLEKK